MAETLPPLTALRAFEVAARQLSFSRAADELNVTPAAVSHQVRALEDHLGVRLFRRRHQGLMLTDAAQRALPGLRDAFDQIARAVDTLRAYDENRPLTVSVAPSLAAKWLVPRIEHFRAAHPGIEVRIDATPRLADFNDEQVDVAIRYGRGGYPKLHVERLPAQEIFPVCAPRLLHGRRPIREPADLRHHTLLHLDWRHQDVTLPDWQMWLASAGVDDEVDWTRGPRFGQQSMAIEAAAAGHGVALGTALVVADDLASGRLVRPFSHSVYEAFTYFLVCRPEVAETPRVRAFRSWLVDELGATDGGSTPSRAEPLAEARSPLR